MSELKYLTEFGEYRDVTLKAYPDTMPLVASSSTIALPDRVLLRPKSLSSFVAAMFWLDAIAERFNRYPHLVLPFVPGARQDRLNHSGDFLFTAKSIAQMINARHLPSVTVLDPHSEVAPALIDRCRVVHAADCITTPPGKYAAVISPDAGAEKRAGEVARKLGVPLIHAWKTRDVATGQISGFGKEIVGAAFMGSKMLIVDDICDGGGTFTGLAREFPEDVDLHLWTTHGIYSKGVAPLAEHFSHIYCTDSILGERPGVIQIDVCKKILEGSL